MSIPSKIEMECEHVVWLKPPLPNVGELIYCHSCDDYRHVGPGEIRFSTSYHPEDNWKSTPQKSGKFKGECLEDGCGYRSEDRSFYKLRDRMRDHSLAMHVRSSLLAKVPIPGKKRVTEVLTDPPF